MTVEPRVRPRGRRLAALVLTVLTLGGCSIPADRAPDGTPGDATAATRERFEQTQEVHLDLRQPLTREQAGVQPGRPGAIIERAGGDRFLDVELTLPGGGVLDVPATGVVFANEVGQPDDSPLRSIVVNGGAEDMAQARTAVERVVAVLGLDRERAGRFFDGVRPGEDRPASQVLVGPPIGYLAPQVEVLYYGPRDLVTINYTLSWDAAAAQGA